MTRNILTVPVHKVEGESSTPLQDLLAVEEPLEIRLGDKTISITMRTPGHDIELAAGFLFTEGILRGASQISGIETAKNTVAVKLKPGVELDLERLERHFYTTSSCGVCGKTSMEALRMQGCPVLPGNSPAVTSAVIHDLPAALRRDQSVFERTGGLHAAALFDAAGNLLMVREDVGRHNAVDKIAGWMFQEKISPVDKIFYTTGRLTSEMVIKTVRMGIPILISRSGFTAWGVELARKANLTLIGRARGKRFVALAGEDRIVFDQDLAYVEEESAKHRRKAAAHDD